MTVTAVSTLGSMIEQDPSDPDCIVVDGEAATDVYPGQYVVRPDTGKWTLAINTTLGHKNLKGGLVVFRARKNTAGTDCTIDSAYDIDAEPYGAWIGVQVGGIGICFITNQSKVLKATTPLMVGATAGSLTRFQGSSGTGSSIDQIQVGTLAKNTGASDTKAYIDLNSKNRVV